jgi:hypothetical protein
VREASETFRGVWRLACGCKGAMGSPEAVVHEG